jgi:hypothetical protein
VQLGHFFRVSPSEKIFFQQEIRWLNRTWSQKNCPNIQPVAMAFGRWSISLFLVGRLDFSKKTRQQIINLWIYHQ